MWLALTSILSVFAITKARDEDGNEITPVPEYTTALLRHVSFHSIAHMCARWLIVRAVIQLRSRRAFRHVRRHTSRSLKTCDLLVDQAVQRDGMLSGTCPYAPWSVLSSKTSSGPDRRRPCDSWSGCPISCKATFMLRRCNWSLVYSRGVHF
jgi:hypothetical protein